MFQPPLGTCVNTLGYHGAKCVLAVVLHSMTMLLTSSWKCTSQSWKTMVQQSVRDLIHWTYQPVGRGVVLAIQCLYTIKNRPSWSTWRRRGKIGLCDEILVHNLPERTYLPFITLSLFIYRFSGMAVMYLWVTWTVKKWPLQPLTMKGGSTLEIFLAPSPVQMDCFTTFTIAKAQHQFTYCNNDGENQCTPYLDSYSAYIVYHNHLECDEACEILPILSNYHHIAEEGNLLLNAVFNGHCMEIITTRHE